MARLTNILAPCLALLAGACTHPYTPSQPYEHHPSISESAPPGGVIIAVADFSDVRKPLSAPSPSEAKPDMLGPYTERSIYGVSGDPTEGFTPVGRMLRDLTYGELSDAQISSLTLDTYGDTKRNSLLASAKEKKADYLIVGAVEEFSSSALDSEDSAVGLAIATTMIFAAAAAGAAKNEEELSTEHVTDTQPPTAQHHVKFSIAVLSVASGVVLWTGNFETQCETPLEETPSAALFQRLLSPLLVQAIDESLHVIKEDLRRVAAQHAPTYD